MQITAITSNQFSKIVKALYYSASSGFVAGFLLAITGVFTNLSNGGTLSLSKSLVTGVVAGAVVGALNSLLVTVKQLFTTEQPPVL